MSAAYKELLIDIKKQISNYNTLLSAYNDHMLPLISATEEDTKRAKKTLQILSGYIDSATNVQCSVVRLSEQLDFIIETHFEIAGKDKKKSQQLVDGQIRPLVKLTDNVVERFDKLIDNSVFYKHKLEDML